MLEKPMPPMDDAWAAIEAFFEQGLTDGLPVVPPKESLVRRFLEHSRLAPGDVIGRVPARELVITARTVAINAVMAGCRPEYLPVVNAVVEAICDETFNIHGSSVSTAGSAQLVIVSGPVVKALGMNSETNVLGPGNRANSTIGRAVRLVVINAMGSVPGEMDMTCLGHGGKYSSVLPEREEASPWEPLRVELGYSLDASTVTVISSQGPQQVHDHPGGSVDTILACLGDSLAACGPGFASFVVLIGPECAHAFRQAGVTKRQVKQALFEGSQRTVAHFKRAAKLSGRAQPGDEAVMATVVPSPEAITLVVAGGLAGRFNALIPPWGKGHASVTQTREVRLPG